MKFHHKQQGVKNLATKQQTGIKPDQFLRLCFTSSHPQSCTAICSLLVIVRFLNHQALIDLSNHMVPVNTRCVQWQADVYFHKYYHMKIIKIFIFFKTMFVLFPTFFYFLSYLTSLLPLVIEVECPTQSATHLIPQKVFNMLIKKSVLEVAQNVFATYGNCFLICVVLVTSLKLSFNRIYPLTPIARET